LLATPPLLPASCEAASLPPPFRPPVPTSTPAPGDRAGDPPVARGVRPASTPASRPPGPPSPAQAAVARSDTIVARQRHPARDHPGAARTAGGRRIWLFASRTVTEVVLS